MNGIDLPSGFAGIKMGCSNCNKLNDLDAQRCDGCGVTINTEILSVAIDTAGLTEDGTMDSYFGD